MGIITMLPLRVKGIRVINIKGLEHTGTEVLTV